VRGGLAKPSTKDTSYEGGKSDKGKKKNPFLGQKRSPKTPLAGTRKIGNGRQIGGRA